MMAAETLAARLVRAACQHADNAGDGNSLCGDLELLFVAALRVMLSHAWRRF